MEIQKNKKNRSKGKPDGVKLIYVFRVPGAKGKYKGALKVGDATVYPDMGEKAADFKENCKKLNAAARDRINEYFRYRYKLLHTEIAIDNRGREFRDYEVHDVLKKSDVENIKIRENGTTLNEWFVTDLDTAIRAIEAVKAGRTVISGMATRGCSPIELREEQEDAVAQAVVYFTKKKDAPKNSKNERKRDNEFLWDAKMRFGKTPCALSVVERLRVHRTLIVTHYPKDVFEGWKEGFHKVFDFFNKRHENEPQKQYCIGGRDLASLAELEKDGNPFIFFASMQDLTGSDLISEKGIAKNEDIFETNWDLIIVDEAHKGTGTPLGKETLLKLKKRKTCVLHLSGTPFNLAEDFDNTTSFTWDYLKEQKAKREWNEKHPGEPNPYAELPEMNIRTYSLGPLADKYPDIAENCFKFSEFFKVGEDEKTFVHEGDVRAFRDLLLKAEGYPFSTPKYGKLFRHTFWVVPGVAQGAALERLLKEEGSGFKHYTIVNVCGKGSDNKKGEGTASDGEETALKKVETAIKKHKHTITISCGRLTTGVSIPEWTAVFYLTGNYDTPATLYMQTIFRAQTPWVKKEKNGKKKILKEKCYVFDFAPDRALSVLHYVSDISSRGYHSPGEPEETHESEKRKYLGELINHMSVIAYADSKMHEIKVENIIDAVKGVYIADVIENGFASPKLFNEKLWNLSPEELNMFDGLKDILGGKEVEDPNLKVTISSTGMTKARYGTGDNDDNGGNNNSNGSDQTKSTKKTPSQAEKDRKKVLAILKNATIKIPLLVFGADTESNDDDFWEKFDAQSFVKRFDDDSWQEFMGKLTKEDFLRMVAPYLDQETLSASCRRVRNLAKSADLLPPRERIEKIVEIHSRFKNPDKETVLTPWSAVNTHLGDTLGGYNFFDEDYKSSVLEEAEKKVHIAKHRIVKNDVTKKTLGNPNAKILEINSKTGLYPLYAAYSLMRYRLSKKSTPKEEKQIWKEVVENNLFIICRTEMAATIVRRTLVGFDANIKPNIRLVKNLVEKVADIMLKKDNECLNGLEDPKLKNFLKDIKTWKNKEMEFDAIIGNPPYQKELKDTTDDPIYHYFVELAMLLNPKYISLIIPSRWMTASGSEMASFRQKMLSDTHIDVLHDFVESSYVFPGTSISGGVCFFRWNQEHKGKCTYTLHDIAGKTESTRFLKTAHSDIFIRYPICADILENVQNKACELNEPSFADLVSGQTPFRGLFTNFFKTEKGQKLSGVKGPITIVGKYRDTTTTRYANETLFYRNGVMDEEVRKKIEAWKFFIPYVNGSKTIGAAAKTSVLGVPTEATNNSACTQTFLLVGPFENEEQTNNAISYLQTKTFRLLVGLRKITPYGSRDTYSFVPRPDFSEPWTDEKLYKKYGFTPDQIAFIEKMIAPMNSTQKLHNHK